VQIFYKTISEIQPSQLYISWGKIDRISLWLNPSEHNYEPIPIKELNGKFIYTDGHSRAFLVAQSGETLLKVTLDEDQLDWHLYEHCVEWCINENISSVFDLKSRVVGTEDYQRLWNERCTKLHIEHGYKD